MQQRERREVVQCRCRSRVRKRRNWRRWEYLTIALKAMKRGGGKQRITPSECNKRAIFKAKMSNSILSWH